MSETKTSSNVSFTDTEFRVVQCILSHPEYLPTVPEITFITDLREDVVVDTLQELQTNDVIETYTNTTTSESDAEVVFYGFTEHGLNIVENKNIFNDVSLMQELYAKVIENTALPENVAKRAAAERPAKQTP